MIYAIIGNGRVATHFSHYFRLSNIEHVHWYRQLTIPLEQAIAPASHVLILIKDDAIDPFIAAHPCLHNKILLHASGAHQSRYAYSCHPLMTFSLPLYSLAQYQMIPFVLTHDAPDFPELFPQLPNPWGKIAPQQVAYYHALCVIANNFTTILWQKIFTAFNSQLNLPAEFTIPLLQQTTHNLIEHPNTCLTGPLARNDVATIGKNLHALTDDPFQIIYRAFVATFQQINVEE